MPWRDVDSILSYLEKKAEDELAHLEEVGPGFFTAAQLIRLKGQWEVKNRLFHIFQRGLIRVLVGSPVWIAGYYLFHWLGWHWLSLASLALFPMSFFVFFAGLLFMLRFFRSRGHLDAVGQLIDEEMRRRAEGEE